MPLGPFPEGMVVDPVTGLVVVAVHGPDGLVLLDREGAIVRRVGLDKGARHLALAGPGGAVLVPEEGADQLTTVRLPAGEVGPTTPVGDNPHDAAVVGERIFVSNEFADSVSVIESGRVIKDLAAPTQPGGVASDGGKVAVVGVRGRRLVVYDGSSLRRLVSLPGGAGPTHVVSDGQRFYVADTNGGAILVYAATGRLRQTARIEAPTKPYGMAVDSTRRRLWVSLTATNSLLEFAVGRSVPRLVARYPTVRQPNSVAVDTTSGRVYVAGNADGVLQILDPKG